MGSWIRFELGRVNDGALSLLMLRSCKLIQGRESGYDIEMARGLIVIFESAVSGLV